MMASCDLSINSSAYKTGADCPTDGVYEVSPADLSGFASVNGSYVFSVVMKSNMDAAITDYCLTNAVSLTSSSSGSAESSSSVTTSSSESPQTSSSAEPLTSSSEAPRTSSSAKPSADCGFYDSDSNEVFEGKKNKSFTFKMTNVQNLPDGAVVTVSGSGKIGSVTRNGNVLTATVTFPSSNSGTSTYTAKSGNDEICSVPDFPWVKK